MISANGKKVPQLGSICRRSTPFALAVRYMATMAVSDRPVEGKSPAATQGGRRIEIACEAMARLPPRLAEYLWDTHGVAAVKVVDRGARKP